ncbi:MAG: hypothetical protein RIF36_00050 [Imperialibacter sp.]|uniref:hypothetical protein n=1 Tax=Imperialibacter sp. TaxID=2038411 RepID=UPI0032ED5C36
MTKSQTGRNILLIEPNYKNKYPPIGLMKIATYHRILGDSITFYKGDLKDFLVAEIYTDCIAKLASIDSTVFWSSKKDSIKAFIKTKRKSLLEDILDSSTEFKPLITEWLKYFSDYYRKKEYSKAPKYDRIYVTTLFTFYWKVTIETISFAKHLVKDVSELKVGGVMASLLPKEIEHEVGIKPMTGLLDKPGVLDDNDIIIDDLPLDYSILLEIDYQYPTQSAYFTFMTKGCTRTCAFCSVPKLEPTYKEKVPTIDKFEVIKSRYGEQQHLLLMDNNVLASPKFPEIIAEIKTMGFYKGATFIEPNQLDISIKNLSEGINDLAFIKRSYTLLHDLLRTRIKGKNAQIFYDILDKYCLIEFDYVTKDNLLLAYDEIKEYYEKYRDKSPRLRYVDFNQGTDARYVNEENMKLMSEIPINPLRIAFDYIGMKKQYVNAVELAAKNGLIQLSNYLLYNFKDKPEDLYERMRINVELNKKLGTKIFSFPMKYIPLFGEDAKHRFYIGKFWNRKFIRAIQSVLNVTKGIVAPGESFFYRAFGKDLTEYFEILYMPETYIVYRKVFEDLGYSDAWRNDFNSLDEVEIVEAKSIIETNDFEGLESKATSTKVLKLLTHYTITYEDVNLEDGELNTLKRKFETLVKKDMFIDLTLTYDFE